jgi:hypothetical protein
VVYHRDEFGMDEDQLIDRIWQDRLRWSDAAGSLKRGVLRWRLITLVLAVAGAALTTAAATIVPAEWVRVAAGAGAVALALVPFITARFLTTAHVSRWLRARSVSEGIKSEVFRYRTRLSDVAGNTTLTELQAKVRKIRQWAPDLEVQLPSEPVSKGTAPGRLTPTDYLRERVREQIERYYRPQARANNKLAERFHRLEIGAGALAAILGALAAYYTNHSVGPWVAVLTTLGATFAAHAAANRYDFQATTYAATARELDDIEQGWLAAGSPTDPEAWSRVVNACEEAISAENRAWMAKLDEPAPAVAAVAAEAGGAARADS